MRSPPALLFLLGVLVGYGIGAAVTHWRNPPALFTRPMPPRKR